MATEIKFTGTTPLEALASLTAFGFCCTQNDEVLVAAQKLSASTQRGAETIAPPTQQPPVSAAATTPPTAPVTPPAPPASVPTAVAPTYNRDQIMTAGAALIDAGKINELMGLLGAFGVQAVTQLGQEQLGAFATELRKLGAQL